VGTAASGVGNRSRRRFGARPGRPHVPEARERAWQSEGEPPPGQEQGAGRGRPGGKIDASKDFYRILQVGPYDGQDAIKAAYRRLLKQHHPDRSSSFDATRRMQEINEAYEVLSDPERRRAYVLLRDAYLHPRVPASPGATASPWPAYGPGTPPAYASTPMAPRPIPRWLQSLVGKLPSRPLPSWAGVVMLLIGLAVFFSLPAGTRESVMAGIAMLFARGIPVVP